MAEKENKPTEAFLEYVRLTRTGWALKPLNVTDPVFVPIPEYMVSGIVNYVTRGQPTGGFLTSIFENDFAHAIAKADDNNIRCLPTYAAILHERIPHTCWGSAAKVKVWLEAHRVVRDEDREAAAKEKQDD